MRIADPPGRWSGPPDGAMMLHALSLVRHAHTGGPHPWPAARRRTARVVVVGAGLTGNTTAKVSLLQGTVLSDIAAHQSDDLLRAEVEA